MPSYLVIGGAGFIGSHLVEALVARGERVRVLDNLSFGTPANLETVRGRIEFIQADASDADAVAKAVQGVGGVFHLASTSSVQLSIENPALNQRSGEIAALTVLQAAKQAGTPRLVYSSSAAVYGDSPEEPKHESLEPRPKSPYAVSKVTSEIYCRLFAGMTGPDTACLRYFNVFGPRQRPSSPYSGVISIFLECIRLQRAPTIYGDGLQTRDFISVHDVVKANLLSMDSKSPLRGEAFNVATGRSVTVLDVWKQLATIAGSILKPRFEPERAGDIRASSASVEKIRQALGFSAQGDFKRELRALAESVIPERVA